MKDAALYDDRGRPVARLLPHDVIGLALVLTTLLALLLRLYRLGEPSLWVDELLTIQQGRMPGTGLLEQFLDDVQCPLPMIITAWIARITEQEFWLRLPSALLGTASVPLLFALTRSIAGPRPALIAALLLAVHPMHLDHSQEVRGYAFLVFFGLAATWLVLNSGARLPWRRLPVLVLLGSAAVLSNLQGLFWMGGLALGIAVSGRVPWQQWGRWAIGFAAILVLTAPWWLGSVQVHETGRLAPSAETGAALRGNSTWTPWALPYAGFVLGFGDSLGPSDDELHAVDGGVIGARHVPAVAAAAVVVSIAVVFGWLGLAPAWRRELLAWAAVPIVMALLLAMRNVKPFNPRYVIAALPVLLVFVAVGLHRCPPRGALVLLAGWLGLTGLSLSRYWFDPAHAREDLRGAAALVGEREGRDDAVLVPAVGQVFRFYYAGSSPTSLMSAADAARGGRSVDDALDGLFAERRYLWFVRSRPWFGDPRDALLRSLESRHRRLARFELAGVDVLLFDRQRAPESPAEKDPSRPDNGSSAPTDSTARGVERPN